ncbi:general substrate transporter [Aspergillus japonicus CBS 114.51]|uniref:General substrate transporter n=1 Tax=Aspergillus japonicus CBS 114.51 TaxID=1448312 RepID=A0A8T8WLW3_ASPJA|nr:general substrate transporter [Aspergillus japonicus CBS 114.51]RAH76767.1 general substrate transporter [Aspergillus japonicus CBS 114.51]
MTRGYLNGVLASPDFIKRYGVTVDGSTYLTARTRSLFTSFQVVGTLIGCLICDPIINWGNRGSMGAGSAVYALGVALQAAGLPAPVFIVGRVCMGMALALASSIIPQYLVEVSSGTNRGRMFAFYLIFLTSGNVLACGISMGTSHFTDSRGWRITICMQLLIAACIGLGALICPEAPTLLLRRNDLVGARRALAILQARSADSPEIGDAVTTMQATLATTSGQVDELSTLQRFRECFRGTDRRRTLLGIGTAGLTILTGTNFWFNYGTTFFEVAGVTNSYLISLVLALINFVCSAPATYLMERAGRRLCLMVGAAGIALTQLLSGIIHDVAPNTVHDKHMLVAGSILFIAIFAPTWGVGGWVVMTEAFSVRLRLEQTAITMIVYWVATWFIGFIVPYLVDATEANLGANVCYLWAATCTACFLWTYFFVPELAGLSVSDMDALFHEKVPAWKSMQWARRRRLQVLDGATPAAEGEEQTSSGLDEEGLSEKTGRVEVKVLG